ncbi:MAG: hypothetical protein WBB42_16790, partial [Polyangiales bacterium]
MKLKIIFICKKESAKMTYRHRELAVVSAMVLGLIGWDAGPAGAQDAPPSPETDASAGTDTDTDTDTGTGTDADTGTDAGTDTDTGTDTDAGTDADADADAGTDADAGADADADARADGPELILAPGEVDNEEPEAGEYRVEIDPLRGMQKGRMRREQKTTIGGYG